MEETTFPEFLKNLKEINPKEYQEWIKELDKLMNTQDSPNIDEEIKKRCLVHRCTKHLEPVLIDTWSMSEYPFCLEKFDRIG